MPRSERKAATERSEEVFAALAHASRREILFVLNFRGGKMTAGEIAERFSCRWPTTTRHLRILEQAGLVRVEKRGRARIYHLKAGMLRNVIGDWLAWFLPSRRAKRRKKAS